MSELKADKTFVFGEECEAYKKSEADKVIAEKDKEIAELNSDIADLRDDNKATDAILDERNAELARWLAQGNGEIYDEEDSDKRIWTLLQYFDTNENLEVLGGFKVRKWDDTEWNEPTVDYLF